VRELTSTVTTKGQVTIPVEIRRFLEVSPRDRIAFVVEGNQVKVRRTESVAQRTAGMLASDQPALPPEQEREVAEQAIAEEAESRSRA
jgi:antitoxin PrlF